MTEGTTFKLGDVVVMKSGGPQMTVITLTGDSAECMWMEKVDKIFEQKKADFPAVSLKRYEVPERKRMRAYNP